MTPRDHSVSASVAQAYDEVATLYADLFADPELADEQVDRRWIGQLLNRLGDGATVADLGCGPAHVTELLRRADADAVGVDASRELVALGRAAFPRTRLVIADITAPVFAPGSLDGVLFRFSLIHLSEPEVEAALGEAAAALRDGGLVLISLQTTERPSGAPEPFDHKVAPGLRWPIDTLSAVCAQGGLVEVGREVVPVRARHRFPEAHLLLRRAVV